MIYLFIIGAIFFLSLSIHFFATGRSKEGATSIFGLFGFLAAIFRSKARPKELTPFQHLDAIQKEAKEAKQEGDVAVLATVPEPTDPKLTRKERWENL